jgi:hypothetical protein
MNTPSNSDECFAELKKQFGEEMVRVFREDKEEDLPKYHWGIGRSGKNCSGMGGQSPE